MRARLHAPPRALYQPMSRWLVGLLAVAMLGMWPAAHPARAADPRLEAAQAQRRETQEALDAVLAKIEELKAETEVIEARLVALTRMQEGQQAQAAAASDAVALQVREAYKHGAPEPLLQLFDSDSVEEAADQAQLLALVAKRNEAGRETASAARVRTMATAAEVERHKAALADRRAELARAEQEAAQHVAAAERQVAAVEATLAAEQAARERARREREARAAAASRAAGRSTAMARSGGAPAAAPGGIACPVGQPRSYSDTWGAARSGGRSHKGTDILAPRGTPIYAYESGTISRMSGNRLGGISLYLRGNSGTEYYYTHLQGYVSGLSPGSRVVAGQQIAFNGDTGNARGIPHLHFEVRPGGGGNVNPYPYTRRACG